MDREKLMEILDSLLKGHSTSNEVVDRLAHLPYEDIDFAKIDHHRPLRTGMPEVIYAAGKTDAQVLEIFARMAAAGGNVLATRVSPSAAEGVRAKFPASVHNAIARTLVLK